MQADELVGLDFQQRDDVRQMFAPTVQLLLLHFRRIRVKE